MAEERKKEGKNNVWSANYMKAANVNYKNTTKYNLFSVQIFYFTCLFGLILTLIPLDLMHRDKRLPWPLLEFMPRYLLRGFDFYFYLFFKENTPL